MNKYVYKREIINKDDFKDQSILKDILQIFMKRGRLCKTLSIPLIEKALIIDGKIKIGKLIFHSFQYIAHLP